MYFRGQGIWVKDTTISCIALADDAVLLSNNIIYLKLLLYLTIQYCNKYKVQLVPDKTKLLALCKVPQANIFNFIVWADN
jgi:hypothetical protein